ncbi:aminotransferase class I/II-fold pyridoxal phosphate-dependent enzyme [Micromonospora sp. NPDC048830]|uniref:aminotransferase class I/II-fold pyridoxal phosphate-dependent enzyme n=1 Tax=Micromonospora sp. NPDC048830 TaxID=3364257 RepID=UPI003724C4AB
MHAAFSAQLTIFSRASGAAVRAIRDDLQQRRDLLTGALARGGIPTLPCPATYFVQLDAAVLGGTDGAALSRDLIHAAGVAVIPSVAFYDDPDAGRSLVRLAICKSPETLRAAADRLVRYRAGLSIPDSPRTQ